MTKGVVKMLVDYVDNYLGSIKIDMSMVLFDMN